MYSEDSVDLLISKFHSSDLNNFRSAVWKVSGSFWQFDEEERIKILNAIIASDEIMIQSCAMWVASMINHILPLTPLEFRFDLVSLLDYTITSPDSHFASYCIETIATMNYLLPDKYIHSLVGKIPSISERSEQYLLQNLLILCTALLDFANASDALVLNSTIQNICKKINNTSFAQKSPSIVPCDVLFYIPDFLTGKSFLQQPTGELISATVIKNAGHRVCVLDNRIYHLSIDSIIKLIKSSNPHMVVITTSPYDQISVYYVDYRLARIYNDAKSIHKNGFFTVICGMHGTIRCEEMLKNTDADVVIRGEWDLTVLSLYEGLISGTLRDVPNIGYLENGLIKQTKMNFDFFSPDVNLLPIPDYSLVDMSAYYGDEFVDNEHIAKESWAAILTQRGCPYQCKFCCNFFKRNVRYKNPSSVVDELEILQKKFAVRHVFFIDYTFTLNHKWVVNVCEEIIRRGLTIKWNCETRVDCLNQELLNLMKRANCSRIWLGSETFSDFLLNNIKKEIRISDTKNALKMIRDAGIKASCFIMTGLPGESKESLSETIHTIQSMNIEYTKSIIVLIPREGSEIYSLIPSDFRHCRFEVMNKYRGLLKNNSITENDLMNVIDLMTKRHLQACNQTTTKLKPMEL